MQAAAISPAPLGRHLPRNLHRLLLGAGSALVLLLLGSSLWQTTASQKALDDLRQQGERLEHLDGMLIQLMDIENVVRSYLLSGNSNHLEPFEESLATVSDALEAVRRDLESNHDNDAALAELSGLVAQKLRSLDRVVKRGVAGEGVRANGNRHADSIRAQLSGLRASVMAEGQTSFERSTYHLERTRRVFVSLAVGALALMIILFVVLERQLRLRAQLAQMLHSENQRLDSLVHERTAELSDLASYLTNVREAEKARLARELHDELGALLTAAKMELNWITSRLNEPTLAFCGEHLARLEGHLGRGIALKRRIIDDLRPPFLEELGLISTLRTLGEEFERDGEETLNLQLPDADVELEPAAALALFRIAQEALTNIRKHARAGSVTLALRATNGWLELEIADDGVGFHTGRVRGGQHGLGGMKHRVQMCAGDFLLASRPGAGTRIVVGIPGNTGCRRSGRHCTLDSGTTFVGLGGRVEVAVYADGEAALAAPDRHLPGLVSRPSIRCAVHKWRVRHCWPRPASRAGASGRC